MGGFNLADYYVDNPGHTWLTGNVTTNAKGEQITESEPWHDTAIKIRGPAADAVEQEWLRRWSKAEDMQQKRVSLSNLKGQVTSRYESAAGRSKARRDAVATRGSGPTQPTRAVSAKDPLAHMARVQIATTRSTKTRSETDILSVLQSRIRSAQNLMYLENVTMASPGIAQALYDRLAARPNLDVIIVCTANAGSVAQLTRRSWLQVALRLQPSRLRSVTYEKAGALRTVLRANCAQWDVRDCTWGRVAVWPDSDTLTFRTTTSPTSVTLNFCDIISIDSDINAYAPLVVGKNRRDLREIVVHSKLCIIDSQHLIVGSANWTYRSMHYDGEMTVFAESQPLATDALNRLLAHFNTVNTSTVLSSANLYATTAPNVRALLNRTLHNSSAAKKVALFPLDHPDAVAAHRAGAGASATAKQRSQSKAAESLLLTRFAPTQGVKAGRGMGKSAPKAAFATVKELASMPNFRLY